ncbi:hypothetical protein L0222_29680 [bacterium]|nr:hypothetical protein [bacterium]
MVITFESRKKSYPAYLFVFTYAIAALVFKDRWQYLMGLVLALVLFLGSYGLGKRLSFFIFKTPDQSLYFPIGLGCALILTFFAASFSTVRSIFYVIWGCLALLSAFELPVLAYRINRNYFWATPLILLGFWSSFSPSLNPINLEYYLGLPHHYLAIGKILTLPENLYSSLPPFGSALTLLFSAVGVDIGVKVFTLLLYFQIISIIVSLLRWFITEPVFAGGNGKDHDYQTDLMFMTRMELLVIPMLLAPVVFAVFHQQTHDLLMALFFCAAIASLIKEYDSMTTLKIWNIGLLLAFALWTKYAAFFYIPWIALLWFGLSGWKFTRENWKAFGLIVATTFLFWLAVPVRNGMQYKDPFYPALSGIFGEGSWTPAQSVYFVSEVMSPGGGLMNALSRFVALVFDPQGIGLVLLLSVGVYPFSRKLRVVNHLLFYGLACYITWFFVYKNFPQFLGVYLVLFPVCYFAFRYLYIRWPKQIWMVWAACVIATAVPLLQFFKGADPSSSFLISPLQTQKEFLTAHLDYYPIVMKLNADESVRGDILLLGENRVAYYKQPVIVGSRYDSTAVLDDLRKATSPEELFRRIRRQGIRYVVYDEQRFHQMYGPMGVFRLTETQIMNLQNMLAKYSNLRLQSGQIRLHELSDSLIW